MILIIIKSYSAEHLTFLFLSTVFLYKCEFHYQIVTCYICGHIIVSQENKMRSQFSIWSKFRILKNDK